MKKTLDPISASHQYFYFSLGVSPRIYQLGTGVLKHTIPPFFDWRLIMRTIKRIMYQKKYILVL